MSHDEHTGSPAVAVEDPAAEAGSAPATTGTAKSEPRRPFTLGVDIGGTGLKASVVDADAVMVADRVRVPTTYPCHPTSSSPALSKLVAPLPAAERASVGFPGMVRDGKVLSAPHFSTKHGPGTRSSRSWPRCGRGSTSPPRSPRRSPCRPRWPTTPTSKVPRS